MDQPARKIMLRLHEDVLPAGAPPVYLPATPRAIYVVQGGLSVESAKSGRWLSASSSEITEGSLTLQVGDEETVVWRWELVDGETPASENLPSAPTTRTTLKLEAQVKLDTGFDWLMRCDSVYFPPAGIALTHVHQGPGIRICLHGEIRIETNGSVGTYGPGQAWFEAGPLPVLAPTTDARDTTFVRCFLLPQQLKGKSSIRYVQPEDAKLPKVQRYRVFAESFIKLPGI